MRTNKVPATLYPNIFTLRKSIQKFQPGIKLSQSFIHELLEMTCMAPSTWNLQHWRFVAIEDPVRKQRLFPIVYHQQQVLDCSIVMIVLGDEDAHLNAEAMLNESLRKGLITQHAKDVQLLEIQQAYESDPSFRRDEAIRNASLAGMQLMLVARDKGVDSCLLRFDSRQLSEELDLPSRYVPAMVICLGYAAKAPKPSLRLPIEECLLKIY